MVDGLFRNDKFYKHIVTMLSSGDTWAKDALKHINQCVSDTHQYLFGPLLIPRHPDLSLTSVLAPSRT